MEHFFRPVEALEKLQDEQLIGGARLLSPAEAEGNAE